MVAIIFRLLFIWNALICGTSTGQPSSRPTNSPYIYEFERCSLVYNNNSNAIDISTTLAQCSYFIDDPLQVISYHTREPVDLQFQLGINSLLDVDEIKGTIILDFYFRCFWNDSRWDIPGLFEGINPALAEDGIEMKDIVRQEGDYHVRIWTPNDIAFTSVVTINQNSETLRLYPGGQVYWSRQLFVELSQSTLEYRMYPTDVQDLVISFESYGLTNKFVNMTLKNPAVEYLHNINNESVFMQNPLWRHQEGSYSQEVVPVSYGGTDGVPLRVFENVRIILTVERISNGILVRLAFPVLLLVLIGAVTFWSPKDSRIETTMTLILAVSALYIVVFSTVPLVGYLTAFDKYFIFLFMLLTGSLTVHQIVSSLTAKKSQYPLRMFGARVLEFLGRVSIIPIALSLYCVNFDVWSAGPGDSMVVVVALSLLGYVALVTSREVPALRSLRKVVIAELQRKLDNPETTYITSTEIFFYNLVKYKIISLSTDHFFKQKRRMTAAHLEGKQGIELKPTVFHDERDDSDDEPEVAVDSGARVDTSNPIRHSRMRG